MTSTQPSTSGQPSTSASQVAGMPVTYPKVSVVISENERDVRLYLDKTLGAGQIAKICEGYALYFNEPMIIFDDHDTGRIGVTSARMRGSLTAGHQNVFIDSSGKPVTDDLPKASPGPQNPQAQVAKKDHIPRPRNAWILYRTWWSGKLHEETPELTAGEISTQVFALWRTESEDVKQQWHMKGK